MQRLGECMIQLARWPEAEGYLARAREIYIIVRMDPLSDVGCRYSEHIKDCLYGLGRALYMQYRCSEAARAFLMVWQALSKTADLSEYADVSYRAGHCLAYEGFYLEAKQILTFSIARWRELGEQRGVVMGVRVGQCLLWQGYVFIKKKKYRNARVRLMEVVNLYQQSNHSEGMEQVYGLIKDIPLEGGDEPWEVNDESQVSEMLREEIPFN